METDNLEHLLLLSLYKRNMERCRKWIKQNWQKCSITILLGLSSKSTVFNLIVSCTKVSMEYNNIQKMVIII